MDLLVAAAHLSRQSVQPQIRIVGDGPERMSLERFARGNRLDVTFLGSLSPEGVRAEMADALVLCVPSRVASDGDAEGFGLVAAEAQAVGVPVIATRSGGLPEAVEQEATGLIVREGSPEELADAIKRCLADDELLRRFGCNGTARARKHFNLATQTRELERIYDSIIDAAQLPDST
jgi:glycosyltransferase involved in cell wall biosynthesis